MSSTIYMDLSSSSVTSAEKPKVPEFVQTSQERGELRYHISDIARQWVNTNSNALR